MIHHNNPQDYYNLYNNHAENSAIDANEMSNNTPFSVRDILNIVDQNEEMGYSNNQEYMQKNMCSNGYQFKRYFLK